MAVSRNLCLVSDHNAGVVLLDLGDPLAPVTLDTLDTPAFARNAVIVGALAYLVDRASGLRIIDLSTPTDLVEVGAVDTPAWPSAWMSPGRTPTWRTRDSACR